MNSNFRFRNSGLLVITLSFFLGACIDFGDGGPLGGVYQRKFYTYEASTGRKLEVLDSLELQLTADGDCEAAFSQTLVSQTVSVNKAFPVTCTVMSKDLSLIGLQIQVVIAALSEEETVQYQFEAVSERELQLFEIATSQGKVERVAGGLSNWEKKIKEPQSGQPDGVSQTEEERGAHASALLNECGVLSLLIFRADRFLLVIGRVQILVNLLNCLLTSLRSRPLTC